MIKVKSEDEVLNELYGKLNDKQKKTIQELRKRMALDLDIEIKSGGIPLDIYLKIARADSFKIIVIENKEVVVNLMMKGRAIKIFEILNYDWKE
jgi:hypothetical protein